MATLGQFADQVIEELSQTIIGSSLDRRNIIVRADAIRSELLSAGNYNATMVNGNWQYNIADDLTELPDQLFISRATPVLVNSQRAKLYANMPSEWVSFKNKNGIRIIHGLQDNSGENPNDRPIAFTSQRAGAGVAYGQLESAQLLGGIGYEIEGQQIFFNNMPSGSYPQVLVTYLPKLSGLKETDVLPMSDEFMNLLMDKTKASFGYKVSTPLNLVVDSQEK